MNARCCAVAVLLLGVGTARVQALELTTLMQALAHRGDARGSFVEEQHLALLDEPLRSSGELVYRAPGHLEKRTLLPRAETLTYDDGIAWLERGKRRMRVDLQRLPQLLPFIESIRATLAGDQAALEQRFDVKLDGTEQQWTLLLVPRDAQARGVVSRIRLQGAASDVLLMEITRDKGDRSLMTITPDSSR